MDISKIKRELNFSPDKSSADLLYEAYVYYISSSKENKTGSAKKPRLGFFKLIKFENYFASLYIKYNQFGRIVIKLKSFVCYLY